MEEFFQAEWEAHYNSNRLGVRLIGQKPLWSRDSGGEAGLHASNVHDCVYAVGSINFTGDTPLSSLATDLAWAVRLSGDHCRRRIVEGRTDQAGDRIRFVPITHAQAAALETAQEARIRTLTAAPLPSVPATSLAVAHIPGAGEILGCRTAEKHIPKPSGDRRATLYSPRIRRGHPRSCAAPPRAFV